MTHFTNLRWLIMSLLLAVGVSAWGASATYQHIFTTKPSTGSNTLSTITWTVSGTNIGNYNSANYCGVQFGTSSKNGSIVLTSANAWGGQASTSYTGYTNVTEVRVWMNAGSGTPSATVTIGGVTATSDGTVVQKNSSAHSYADATCVTYTPASNGNTGVIVINASTSSKAGYLCAIEIDCEEPGGSTLANSDLAITNAPVALSFDLYNNSAAQTVSFTTSSTGAVTVSGGSGYVTTSLSGNIITVTPTAVTPSAQTITINQAADATYEAGSVTFTVNVTDSSPFAGGEITFVAGTDVGTTDSNNSPDAMTKSVVTISSTDAAFATAQYRFYSGSDTEFSVPTGYKITKIEFTVVSSYSLSNFYLNNSSPGSYNSSTGIWTGSANSVSIHASQQVRLSQIVVTVAIDNKEDPTFAWSDDTATATVGAAFTAPTLSNTSDGTVTYSSSDPTVASIDENTGAVTIVAAGTTTITAQVTETTNYYAATTSYELTVNPAAGTQPMEVTINLNNTTYGTSYTGAITPIASFTSASGTINNVTVTYAKGIGSNAYINNSQTRIYNGNTLTFEAPAGYVITGIQFSGSSWKSDFTGDSGNYDTSTHAWSGEARSIVFTRTESDNMQLTQAVVTLAADKTPCVTGLSLTPTALNLLASGTFTATTTSVESGAGTITYTYSCEDEGLTVTSAGAYTATAVGTYNVTVTATPTNTTDYKEVSAVVEVTVTDPREATITFFPEESYTVALGQTFTAPTATTKTTPGDVTLPEGRANYTYTSSNTSVARVDAATGAITIIDAGSTTITATYAGDDTDYQGSEGSYVLHVTDPSATDFTWDLSIASYDSNPTEQQVQWSSDVATMTINQGSSTTAANNYLGGDSNNRTSSRFYNGEVLTIDPTEGTTITSLIFEATTESYASALENSTWTNATVTVSGTTVTVTPTDGTIDIVANITGTCGFTSVTVNYSNASTVAKPVITPATGKYSVRPQTVNITCATEGATIYYTTDGSIPTTSSTRYTGSFDVNRKTSIMAIAVKDGHQSRVASVDISFEVTAPVFNWEDRYIFDDEYTVEISAQTGVTIYYITQSDQMYVTTTGTTNDPTNSTLVTDEDGNPRLVSSARIYNGGLTFNQAMMITAVAVDADGNQSDPVTVEYQYTGTAGIPYTSRFAATLGDFSSVAVPSTSSLYWRINTNKGADAIAKWGEERAYAYISGKSHTTGDKASLTSPTFDLTEYEEASFSFIHAGAYFNDVAESQNYCKVYVDVLDTNGDVSSSTQITVPGWYNLDKTEQGKYAFTRANSGDIDLTDYAGEKIKIRFEFTVPSDVTTYYGTWNVDQITVLATKAETETEKAAMNSKGWTTYVFDHDIDAYQTTLNYTNQGKTLKIYKVTEFDKTEVVLQQLGKFETYTTENNSERYIKAKTPVVIEGPAGETIEYVIYTDAVVNMVKNNLLIASLEPNTVTASAEERYYVLQWKDHGDNTGEPIFNRVKTGREIPDHKAYLNGVDEIEQVSTKTNSVKGIYVLGGDGEDEATGIAEIDKTQETLKNGVIYNLAGQRVVNPTKGLYIVNGKKVYLK